MSESFLAKPGMTIVNQPLEWTVELPEISKNIKDLSTRVEILEQRVVKKEPCFYQQRNDSSTGLIILLLVVLVVQMMVLNLRGKYE